MALRSREEKDAYFRKIYGIPRVGDYLQIEITHPPPQQFLPDYTELDAILTERMFNAIHVQDSIVIEQMEGRTAMPNTKQELELARQAMIRQMAETELALKKYEKFPEDTYPIGTILRMTKTITVEVADEITMDYVAEFVRARPGRGPMPKRSTHSETRDLTYAWLKVQDGNDLIWYSTGVKERPLSWAGLVEWMIDGEPVTSYDVLHDPDKTVSLAP